MKSIVVLSAAALCMALSCFSQTRPNGGSTRAALNALMEAKVPSLQYYPSMPSDSMAAWRGKMAAAMASIMRHPEAPAATEELIESARRDGYTIERWRSWPLPSAPVHYYVLIPDSAASGSPSALCIPGFGQTKELLAGERSGDFSFADGPSAEPGRNAMALQYVRNGYTAFAVDNPCFGELSDNGYSDYLASSRMLLELGWSYLGLASWQDQVVLDAMRRHPAANPKRIVVSGFSLGTEPLMVLGLLNPDIYAFVYNDFLCRTRERILVMDKTNEDGSRPLPNSIEHLIPEFLTYFDFPDIVAALAPRPVICTEGGLDRDFLMVADAFEKAGASDSFSYHHYPKFADPAARALSPTDTMPAGIDRDTFFRLANVDPPSHCFKSHLVFPWLASILGVQVR